MALKDAFEILKHSKKTRAVTLVFLWKIDGLHFLNGLLLIVSKLSRLQDALSVSAQGNAPRLAYTVDE